MIQAVSGWPVFSGRWWWRIVRDFRSRGGQDGHPFGGPGGGEPVMDIGGRVETDVDMAVGVVVALDERRYSGLRVGQ